MKSVWAPPAVGGPENLLGTSDWRGRVYPENQGSDVASKNYIQGVHLYLKEKKHSDCASEMVRVQS
jgi:hypothetical protein